MSAFKNAIANPFCDARFIKAQKEHSGYTFVDPLPFFRREFELDGEVESARIFVQSPGFACYYINGKPITEDIFISATSDYKKILWYDEYDVTPLLKKGKNVICAIAGNGFFNEPFRTAWEYHEAYWRDAPQILVSLWLNGENSLVSDSSWKVSRDFSYITYSHLRSGEFVDMRKYDESWLEIGFDDSMWMDAIERSPEEITATLRPIICQPVREVEILDPVDIRKTNEGYLIDFARTISGYMGITFKAPEGRELEFYYTEDIYPGGKIKMNGLHKVHCYPDQQPFHVNKAIASGKTDTFKPLFCYHGFRYVLIKGLDDAPRAEDIKAYFIHNDIERRSEFKCGNPVIQYIYDAGIQSTYSNMFWSLTDCPTREKLGWMNDAQASIEQTLINFDIMPFYNKWFEDIKADMCEDGALHAVVPSHTWGRDWGPVCDLMLYELPYRAYLYTGDSSMLVGAIEYFDRYLDFLEGYIKENKNFILADWMGWGNSPLIPCEFVRDIIFLKGLKITSLAYKLDGRDTKAIDDKLESYKNIFASRYLDKDGRCTVNEQTAVALMIMFGIYTDKEAISKQMAEIVERDGCTLTAGMLGVQYLYDALGESGRGDLAYKLITESDPGYKTWYEHGADTLWECWDGADRDSHNHHMFSNVIGWFFKTMLGIGPDVEHPGFEKVTLRPQFIEEAGYVWAKMQTVRGEIELGWEYKDGEFLYTVIIPKGIEATYNGQTLCVGKNTFVIKK